MSQGRAVTQLAATAFATLAAAMPAIAQVTCQMPNGVTITLQNASACPSGATKAQTADGKPAPIRPTPAPALVKPTAPASTPQHRQPPATPPPAAPGEMTIQTANIFGCKSKEKFSSLVSMATVNDMEAFKKSLGIAFLRSECVPFKQGTVVYLEDTSLFSGMTKVRPRGSVDSYWVPMKAVK